MLKIITVLGLLLVGHLANRQREPQAKPIASHEVQEPKIPLFKMTDYEY